MPFLHQSADKNHRHVRIKSGPDDLVVKLRASALVSEPDIKNQKVRVDLKGKAFEFLSIAGARNGITALSELCFQQLENRPFVIHDQNFSFHQTRRNPFTFQS